MADEWYYSHDGEKAGPFPSSELRALAESGRLLPTDLIWKKGMPSWAPANAVKGLFVASASASPAPQPSSPGRRATPAKRPDGWHPLDVVIGAVRDACPNMLAEHISINAGRIGVTTLYGSAALTLIGGILLTIRSNSFLVFLASLGVALGILVGQYVAYRLLSACRQTIAANRSTLPSHAIPDSIFLLIAVATVAGGIGLTWMAITEQQLVFFVAALGALFVGTFAAITAVTPEGLGFDIEPECRAAQEAVGVLTFFVKLFLRCTPLLFAAGVAFATYRLLEFGFQVITFDRQALPRVFMNLSMTLGTLFGVVAIPCYAYILMLVYYLTLDVISAIVSLPNKLDVIAKGTTATEQP